MTDIKLLPRPPYPPQSKPPKSKRSSRRYWYQPPRSQTSPPALQRPRRSPKPAIGGSEIAFRVGYPTPRLQRSHVQPSCRSVALPQITQREIRELQAIAVQLQQWFQEQEGIHYERSDLLQVVQYWLKDSLKQLVKDAVEHCVSGVELYSFNRRGFKKALEKVQPKSD